MLKSALRFIERRDCFRNARLPVKQFEIKLAFQLQFAHRFATIDARLDERDFSFQPCDIALQSKNRENCINSLSVSSFFARASSAALFSTNEAATPLSQTSYSVCPSNWLKKRTD